MRKAGRLKKSTLLLTLFLVMSFGLYGCKENSNDSSSSQETIQTEESGDKEETTVAEPGESSSTSSEGEDMISLVEGQTYSYDLDLDGVEEKIRYQSELREDGIDDYKYPQIYINDELLYDEVQRENGGRSSVYVVDIDEKDNSKELFIQTSGNSDGNTSLNFLRYEREELVKIDDLSDKNIVCEEGYVGRITIDSIKGDGIITLIVDTPIYRVALGCYFVKVSFKLEGNEINEQRQDVYPIVQGPLNMPEGTGYVVKNSFETMLEVGGSQIAFSSEINETLKFDAICWYNGQLYGKFTNSKGVSGWLVEKGFDGEYDEQRYFVEVPAWG